MKTIYENMFIKLEKMTSFCSSIVMFGQKFKISRALPEKVGKAGVRNSPHRLDTKNAESDNEKQTNKKPYNNFIITFFI
jgi:hypothetical protein